MKKALWFLISLLVLTVGATVGYSAYADKPARNEAVHVPPNGWDPIQASDEELNFYNYPRRPKDPMELKEWERIVSSGKWDKGTTTEFRPTGIHGDIFREIK